MTSPVDIMAIHMRFRRMWSLLGCQGDPDPAFADLRKRYAETHRAYHTLEHIEDCLLQLEAACPRMPAFQLAERAEVEAVLFWHDAVYDISSTDNEERSAELANDALRNAGLGDDSRGRILNGILATKHSSQHQLSGLASLIVDIDLSILGSGPERYARYREGIENEYRFGDRISERDYLGGRIQFLANMLVSQEKNPEGSLFQTAHFRARYHDTAVRNMRNEIAILDVRLNH